MKVLYPREDLVAAAVEAARRSACAKSQRGVAIVGALCSTESIVVANNSPPDPFYCDRSLRCRTHCRRLAVHAEQRALLQFPLNHRTGAMLLHVKVNEAGVPVPSGDPSCYECSKLILDARIGTVWLLRSVGWRAYSAIEFHDLSLDHHRLPRIYESPSDDAGDDGPGWCICGFPAGDAARCPQCGLETAPLPG